MSMTGQKEFWGEPIIPATAGAFLFHVAISLGAPADKQPFERVIDRMKLERARLEDQPGCE